jgi:Domain of unknown function (DUF4124)
MVPCRGPGAVGQSSDARPVADATALSAAVDMPFRPEHRQPAMTRCPILLLLFVAAGAVLPTVAFGQLYRWIDADGTVNYGDTPPKGAKDVRVVGKDSGNLTVVPAITPEQRERLRQREEQRRIETLEREVQDLRAREEARASAPPEVVYEEVYVPVYGGAWPGTRPPGHRPGKPGQPIGKPRPEPPIGQPRPPDRTPPVGDLPPNPPRDPPGTMIRR